jgi:VIT1/CCC1 family predicted Fe2+/Mn2+ transporter
MDEIKTASIYDRLSKLYVDKALSEKLARFSEMENEHAVFWSNFLIKRGIHTRDLDNISYDNYKFSFIVKLYRLLGIGLTIKILEIGERDAIRQYLILKESPKISEEEKEGINKIIEDELRHEEEFEEYEERFKFFIKKVSTMFYHLSYGLITVLSISAGLAGVYNDSIKIGLIGLVVGLSDVLSTMIGEYMSRKTENQVNTGILARITLASRTAPNIFAERIVKYMKQKDISEDIAKALAREASSKPNLMKRYIGEEEYGIKINGEEKLFEAALSSGLFRLIGTLLPLSPYLVGGPILLSIALSIIFGIFMLSISGFFLALSTNLDIKKKVKELIINGTVLTILIFGLGKLTSLFLTFI